MDGSRRGHPLRRGGERRAGGSRAPRAVVRRHRARGVRLAGRRRSLAIAAAQPARHLRARPGGARQRSRGGHARPVVLDPGRHRPAPRAARGGRRRGHGRVSVSPGGSRAGALERKYGHAPSDRRAGRAQSSRWRRARLLSHAPGGRADSPGDSRSGGRRGTTVRERRRAGGTGLGSQYPFVVDPAPAASGDGRRDASLRVGPARTTTSGAASRLSDRGDLARHAT